MVVVVPMGSSGSNAWRPCAQRSSSTEEGRRGARVLGGKTLVEEEEEEAGDGVPGVRRM